MARGEGKRPAHDVPEHSALSTYEGLPDGQLLERFVRRNEREAFTELVRRHHRLVMAVCRRLLRDSNDADDACQATFVVLVRKAAGLRAAGSLGGWLRRVAWRTARRARAELARRRSRETRGVALEALAGGGEGEAAWEGPLQLELSRLPERYRLPLVACHLRGQTLRQVAQALGWPRGTVASRLARGRGLLRRRLARRGLAPTPAP